MNECVSGCMRWCVSHLIYYPLHWSLQHLRDCGLPVGGSSLPSLSWCVDEGVGVDEGGGA